MRYESISKYVFADVVAVAKTLIVDAAECLKLTCSRQFDCDECPCKKCCCRFLSFTTRHKLGCW